MAILAMILIIILLVDRISCLIAKMVEEHKE